MPSVFLHPKIYLFNIWIEDNAKLTALIESLAVVPSTSKFSCANCKCA